MILINDLLRIPKEQFRNVKVKLNQYNGYDNPIDLYKVSPDTINEQWLFWRQKNKYFSVGQIAVCLAHISGDLWLLTTVKRVVKDLDVQNGINYEGEELTEYKQYFGRVIVKYHKPDRQQCPYYINVYDKMEISQILPDSFDDDDFPGYDKVKVSYKFLESIVKRGKKDWIAALSNQKAVYLITDCKTGMHYVGSATGNKGMLLQRWESYIKNGHGGNTELVKLVKENGFNYIKENFQYTILENYNSKIDDAIILEREKWWKKVLLTTEFGYNDNL